MKKFIVLLKDKQKGTLTDDLLSAHVQHLAELDFAGRLFLCGPFTENNGALQILLADSIKEAEGMIKHDPFIENGYYQNYELFELIEANSGNNWLVDDGQTRGNFKKK